MNIDKLHQLPESHPIARRDRISLAHIDTAAILRRHDRAMKKVHDRAVAQNITCAATFSIGQTVSTRQQGNGVIVEIADNGRISVDIEGRIRKYTANMIFAL